jgi:D-tyrosyl-tRNA(Tyr) deacylase
MAPTREFLKPADIFRNRSFMKIVLQRVLRSSVSVKDEVVGEIGKGLMILFGAEKGDGDGAVDALVDKVLNLRIFADDQGKMNLSCLDVQGEILVVSQFTLAGDCSRGRRPGFDNAAPPAEAERLYSSFVKKLAESKLSVQEGRFGADMQVDIVNDGPVTFILER